MKKFLNLFAVAAFAFLFIGALAAPAFAQDDEGQSECQKKQGELYQKYMDNYAGNIDQRTVAIGAAKDYVKLCESEESEAEQAIVKYMKESIPALEQGIKDELAKIEEQKKVAAEQQRIARFDKAYRAKDWDEAFAAGDAILSEPPVKLKIQLDMRILLASAGTVLAEEGNSKFNSLTLKHAKDALSRIAAGEESGTGKWGAYNYEWNSKENALGWLNYGIGYITYSAQNNPAEGVKYYYAATQHKSGAKELLPLYVALGDWYRIKAGEIGQERAKLDLTEEAGEMQKANIDKALELIGKEKAYAERAMDAYARAYNLAKSKNASEEVRTGLYNTIKSLFQFRYDGETQAEMRSDASINSYVAGISANALPNPANEPQPIVEKKPGEAGDSATDGSTEGAATSTTGQRSRTVGAVTKKSGN